MFKKEIFLICQNQVLNNDEEKLLKKEIYNYINKSLNFYIFKKNIKYIDYYTSRDQLTNYSFMTTCKPHNNLFNAWMYELYAFSFSNDENIFKDYSFIKKEFKNNDQKIIVYKFKI